MDNVRTFFKGSQCPLIWLWALVILIIPWDEVKSAEIHNNVDGIRYLLSYGYMPSTTSRSNMTTKAREEAVRKFQSFCGLPPTGQIDSETMRLMNAPRCANKDPMDMTSNTQRKLLRGWSHSDLRYRITNYPRSGLSMDAVRTSVRQAFELWERWANFQASEVLMAGEEVDIEISFVGRNHGDNMNFGEKAMGVALAHAFLPSKIREDEGSLSPSSIFMHHELEGDIHFDDSRGWTVDTADGINFMQVCAHEIGHALGLEHSVVNDSVMHFLAKIHFDPNFSLHEDDIKGIQNLYGKRETVDVVNVDDSGSSNYDDDDLVAAGSDIMSFAPSTMVAGRPSSTRGQAFLDSEEYLMEPYEDELTPFGQGQSSRLDYNIFYHDDPPKVQKKKEPTVVHNELWLIRRKWWNSLE